MSKITLEVLSPNGVIFSDTVDSVSVKGVDGELGILHGHVPFFTQLKIDALTYKKAGKENYIAVMGGFLEFANNKANIITSSGEIADSIDKGRALRDKEEAEKVAMKKAGDEAYLRAEREIVKAQARLKILDLLERSGRNTRI